jgi:hypothetical protein
MKRKSLTTMAVWGLLLCASFLLVGLLGIAAESPGGATASLWLPALGFGSMRVFGVKFYDWSKVDKTKPSERKGLIVDAFNRGLAKIQGREVTGQKFTGPDPNLQGPSPVVLVMSDTVKIPDRGYELLFDEVNMRQSTNESFELLDVKGGVTFYQQLHGEEARLTPIRKAAKTLVSMLRFTGGFSVLDDWLRFNQYYKIDELTRDTVRSWYGKKATIFYGLLSALTGIDEAFDTDDATTINNACGQILEDLQAAGYDVDENSEFIVTCNPKLRGRIFKALAATYTMPNANTNQILFNIRAVVSTTKVPNTHYFVSLPGYKNKRGEWEDFNARPAQRDELKLGADHIWTGGYNGIIGQKLQHRKCALA